MTSAQVASVVVVLVLIAGLAGAAAWYYVRHRTLKERFGPEYDLVVADRNGRIAAERELRQRQRRHDELRLRTLDAADKQRYAEQWRAVQELFLEDPEKAVVSSDELVTRLVGQLGYPTEDREEQLAYLSVEHARTLGHYRDAYQIYLRGRRGEASTEELRQAIVHYREIFADLLGAEPHSQSSHMNGRQDAAEVRKRTDA
jgi:hypothetical protein